MFKYRYAYLSMFQVDSRWTPENHLESSGIHLNSVGECKVLAVAAVEPLANAHAWAKPGRSRRLAAAQQRHPTPKPPPRHHPTTQPNDPVEPTPPPRHRPTMHALDPALFQQHRHVSTQQRPQTTPISRHVTPRRSMHTAATSPPKGSSRRAGRRGWTAGTRREEEEGKGDDVHVVPWNSCRRWGRGWHQRCLSFPPPSFLQRRR